MIIVTVARKPLEAGTVAANVLLHGTGALHIAATRIETADDLNGGAYSAGAGERHDGAENWRYKRGEEGGLAGVAFQQPTGRWPANLILEHKPECRQVGVREEAGYSINRFTDGMKPFGNGAGHAYVTETKPPMRVGVWDCAMGCPVAELDVQSLASGMHSAGSARSKLIDKNEYAASSYHISGTHDMRRLGDEGGASRFFKQVGGEQTR